MKGTKRVFEGSRRRCSTPFSEAMHSHDHRDIDCPAILLREFDGEINGPTSQLPLTVLGNTNIAYQGSHLAEKVSMSRKCSLMRFKLALY